MERYLIAAIWLRDHLDVQAVTNDHIYTCYKYMAWTPFPRDFNTGFSNAKQKGWFQRAEERGAWTMTTVGEDYANNMGSPATQ